MDYVLLVISFSCLGLKSVFAKLGNKHFTAKHNIYTYNFYMLVVTFLFTAAIGIPTWNGLGLPALILAVFLRGASGVFSDTPH